MAYANELDPTTPTNLDPAHQGDDQIRGIKAAMIERLNTVFENIQADPLVPKVTVFGDRSYAKFDLNEGTVPYFGVAQQTLSLQVTGTTNASGELFVSLLLLNSTWGRTFDMANCIAMIAQPMTPDHPAVAPNSPVVPTAGGLTLRTLNEAAHTAQWSVILVFSA